MKRIVVLSFPAFLLSFIANSQTTSLEYLYVTKGYKAGLETGSDIKRGYGIRQWYDGSYFDKGGGQIRKFKIYHFYKESTPAKTVAFMLMLVDKNSELDWVFCVPSAGSTSEVWNQFWDEVYGSSPGVRNAIIRETSYMLMNAINKLEASR